MKEEFTIDANQYKSIEKIENKLIYFRDMCILAKVEINGKTIYSNSINLKKELYLAYYNITENELDKIKALQFEKDLLINDIKTIEELENNKIFKFYLGLSISYIKPNLKDEFKLEMIRKYSFYQEKLIKYVSAILIALNNSETKTIRLNLYNIFQTALTKKDLFLIDESINIAFKYGYNSNILKNNLFGEILDNTKNNLQFKINECDKSIKQYVL